MAKMVLTSRHADRRLFVNCSLPDYTQGIICHKYCGMICRKAKASGKVIVAWRKHNFPSSLIAAHFEARYCPLILQALKT